MKYNIPISVMTKRQLKCLDAHWLDESSPKSLNIYHEQEPLKSRFPQNVSDKHYLMTENLRC